MTVNRKYINKTLENNNYHPELFKIKAKDKIYYGANSEIIKNKQKSLAIFGIKLSITAIVSS